MWFNVEDLSQLSRLNARSVRIALEVKFRIKNFTGFVQPFPSAFSS